jgi:hypothetical protein
MKKAIVLAAVLGVWAAGGHAQATILSPGDMGVPVGMMSAGDFATLTGETLLGTKSSLVSTSTFSAMLKSQVYQGGAGYLDFVYTVTNNGPDTLDRVSMGIYPQSGFTDAYWVAGSTVAPSGADRSPFGVAFTFAPPIPSPGGTETLVIRTHNTSFGDGILSVQDTTNAHADSFAPTPLPSSLVLFGTGILAFAGQVARRLRKGWLCLA